MAGICERNRSGRAYEKLQVYDLSKLFEGFGLPVTEAMAAGVPVLCSNVTSLPEVGGEAVFYFDPYDPEDICRKMEYVREHPEEVEKKLGKVPEQLSRFDLEHYLSGLLNVFEKAVSE